MKNGIKFCQQRLSKNGFFDNCFPTFISKEEAGLTESAILPYMPLVIAGTLPAILIVISIMKEFLLHNWKWIIGTLIAIIGIYISYKQLTKKDKVSNYQKSGKNSINIQSSKNVKVNKK